MHGNTSLNVIDNCLVDTITIFCPGSVQPNYSIGLFSLVVPAAVVMVLNYVLMVVWQRSGLELKNKLSPPSAHHFLWTLRHCTPTLLKAKPGFPKLNSAAVAIKRKGHGVELHCCFSQYKMAAVHLRWQRVSEAATARDSE